MVNFINGIYEDAYRRLCQGQLMVVPSGPGLATIDKDIQYTRAIKGADFAIPDSGIFVLLNNLFTSNKINKLSGLKFLQNFFNEEELRNKDILFLVDPNKEEYFDNRVFLNSMGIPIQESDQYIAPIYEKGKIEDYELLSILESKEKKPKYILLNIGGGIQEPLGYFLKTQLSYDPGIICTGAAIAFLTGRQARIPKWIDSLYLGWLYRIINSPKRFFTRYFKALRFIYVFFNKRELIYK